MFELNGGDEKTAASVSTGVSAVTASLATLMDAQRKQKQIPKTHKTQHNTQHVIEHTPQKTHTQNPHKTHTHTHKTHTKHTHTHKNTKE